MKLTTRELRLIATLVESSGAGFIPRVAGYSLEEVYALADKLRAAEKEGTDR